MILLIQIPYLVNNTILFNKLNKIFFVCTGSEANDLALRIAKTYTKANNVLVMNNAYHGHTNSLIDLLGGVEKPLILNGPAEEISFFNLIGDLNQNHNNIIIKYLTPSDPPEPDFCPIVLSTIFTWR